MLKCTSVGSLPKRLKGPVLKTGRGRKARESSNLSASAINLEIKTFITLLTDFRLFTNYRHDIVLI